MSERDELRECGGVPLGDGFNQDSFRTHNVIEGANIANGYCAGVALDWIRRVLQPRNRHGVERTGSTHLDYASPKYVQTPERKVSTVRRMATAYGGSATSYVSETERSKLKHRLESLQNGTEENYTAYGLGVPIPGTVAQLLKKVWDVPGNSTFRRFSLSSEPAGTLTKATIAQLLTSLNQNADPQQQPLAAGGREWASFADELDTRFQAIRISETRQVTARPFSNLQVVRSSPSTNYTSAGVWATVLIDDGLMVDGGTLVSMKPTSVSNGHQIAIHQKSAEEFVLFDPNYGAFRCSATALERCLQQLFWRPYTYTEGNGNSAKVQISGAMVATLDGNRAIYCRRQNINSQPTGEWKAMGYTIFQNLS
jgi:hypothetical protein